MYEVEQFNLPNATNLMGTFMYMYVPVNLAKK